MEDILPIACAGSLILLVLALVLYFFINLNPFSYDKRKEGVNTCLTITAKHNLNKVTVTANVDGDDVTFERRRIRKGQSVDFVYPLSPKPAKLTVEVESGNVRALEV
ncbi:hypothetical protein H0O00_03040 [Candidatus Micrarchaeota archaeon]|nr:hypothetical protein [Candidatus Micrarchaeota archaeon]